MKILKIFCFLILLASPALAQKLIKGKVNDSQGKPIPSASVNLKDHEDQIIAFTRTDEKGNFTLKFEEDHNNLRIEATVIGYAKQILEVKDLGKTYELTLKESEINLKTVVVKNRPSLTANGDTLNYKTSDFADQQDRSIGDVLKKMPGITVEENGKISYNGRNISNLYLDKDNLLDDKYGIATKSVPHGAVEKVQVIENDQPVKMLRKNNMSDDVAINLVIKDDARLKLMGDVKAGLGTPDRFDGNVNAMLFKKQLKFINNIKGNNIGIDPGNDVTSFNLADYQKRLDNDKPGNFLSAGAAGVPTLPQTRSLLNKAGLINLNNLYKFNEELQIRANVSYLYDRRTQQFQKFSETYLPNETITYTELQDNSVNPQSLQSKFTLTDNAENHYLNNHLVADYIPKFTNSRVIINGVGAGQTLSQKTFDISNEFSYRKKLKSDHTINFYSYLNSTSQPEVLNIRPGLNETVLNDGNPYAGLDQYLKLPTWYTNNYLSFGVVKGHFVQTYKTGFNLQYQQLNSELYRIQNNDALELVSNTTNNLNWNRNKIYVEGAYEYTNDQVKIGLSLPLSYNRIAYQDPGKQLDAQLYRIFLNPSLNMKYQTSAENYITANYSFKNDLGGIDDIYRGTILKNYRSLLANDAPISERKTHQAGAGFNFRKAMQMFFLNLGTNYTHTTLNTISSFILTNNIQQRIVLPIPNQQISMSMSANASKYLFALRATVNAGISLSSNTFDQLQNNNRLTFQSDVINYRAGFDSKLSSFANFSYNATFSESANRAKEANSPITRYQQLRHQAGLTATTFKHLFINLSGEHIYTHQVTQPDLSYVFADLNLRYKWVKYKTDLEFAVTNLANVKTFEAINLSVNSLTAGSYLIPGRVAMLKATFNF